MIASVTSGSTQAPLTEGLQKSGDLGKDAFLRLLTTQLSYQDPMDPVKNEDFVAQLAQFSSLEQLTSINGKLSSGDDAKATASLQRTVESNTAVGLIGRNVEIAADVVTYLGGGSVSLGYSLLGPANEVTLKVVDGAGNVVRTLAKDNPSEGAGSIVWDGRNDGGNQVAAGTYRVLASAVNGQGNAVSVSPSLSGLVTGVAYDPDGSPLLQLDGGQAPLSSVVRVTQGS